MGGPAEVQQAQNLSVKNPNRILSFWLNIHVVFLDIKIKNQLSIV